MTTSHRHTPAQPHSSGHSSSGTHATHHGHGRHGAHPRRAIKSDALPARFRLHAPHAKKVMLVCTAAGHEPHAMHRTADGYWHLALELRRGRHEYYFLVDGERHLDPKSRGTITHADGSRYSVIEVGY